MPDETSTPPVAPSADRTASDAKPCPVCGEEIKVSARKCIHCSSDLTWRTYLSFSSTTLALLTALVSVIATGAPLIRQATEIKDSSMQFFVISAGRTDRPYVKVIVNNVGTRSGMLLGGEIAITNTSSSVLSPIISMSFSSSSLPDKELYLANPGTTKVIDLDIVWCCTGGLDLIESRNELRRLLTIPEGKDEGGAPISSATCKIELKFLNFSESYSRADRPFRCASLAFILEDDKMLFPRQKE
jgi:hypothetical protein